MTIFSFSRLFAIAATLVSIALVASAPALDEGATAVAHSAPHFVIYSDQFVSGVAPPVNKIAGFNVL